jgi:uncharacterized repeat protein (TIGR02543 family)
MTIVGQTDMFKKSKITIIISLIMVITMMAGTLESVYAWENGGKKRTSYQVKTAEKKANFTSPDLFTLNILPISTGNGYGIGTHDYILEQAIAQAINVGADVSWINVTAAQKGTSEPDYFASIMKRFRLGGDYRGYLKGGTGPRDVGILYAEVCAAIEKGNLKIASQKLGWIAHYMGDMVQPFHVVPWAKSGIIKAKYWHDEHVAFEHDLDHYMEYTIGTLPSKWPVSTEVAWKCIPALAEATNDTSPGVIRLAWFGGEYTKPPVLKKSARKVVIDMSAKIRNNYTMPALKAWSKNLKPAYKTDPTDYSSRGAGTKYLLKNAPAILNTCSTALASLIVALSNPATRRDGIDKIKTPKLKVKAVKFPKYMTAGLTAKALKAKQKELKKSQMYSGTVTIKNTDGKPVKEMPVTIYWRNKSKKILKSQKLWTNSKGQVTGVYTVLKLKKNEKMSFSVTVPTSTYTAEKTKTFTVKNLVTCKVKWKAGKGKVATKSKTLQKGKNIGKLPKATRKGYKFLGWYTKSSGGTKIKKTTVINKNVSYYAHWKKS